MEVRRSREGEKEKERKGREEAKTWGQRGAGNKV